MSTGDRRPHFTRRFLARARCGGRGLEQRRRRRSRFEAAGGAWTVVCSPHSIGFKGFGSNMWFRFQKFTPRPIPTSAPASALLQSDRYFDEDKGCIGPPNIAYELAAEALGLDPAHIEAMNVMLNSLYMHVQAQVQQELQHGPMTVSSPIRRGARSAREVAGQWFKCWFRFGMLVSV